MNVSDQFWGLALKGLKALSWIFDRVLNTLFYEIKYWVQGLTNLFFQSQNCCIKPEQLICCLEFLIMNLPCIEWNSMWQCTNHFPGLSDLNLTTAYAPVGSIKVSFWGGFIKFSLGILSPCHSLAWNEGFAQSWEEGQLMSELSEIFLPEVWL